MEIKRLILPLSLLFILFLSFTVSAKQTMEGNGFIIESNDMYNCQPILNDDKCLIIADFIVVNTENSNKYIYLDTSFTDSLVVVDGYKDKNTDKYYRLDKDKTKTKDKIKIDKYQNKTFIVYFWTEYDGKFNITLDDETSLTILDPFYNISFSPKHPSYYLQEGDVMRYNHSQFDDYTLITDELSDGNSSTSFMTLSGGSPVEENLLIEGWFFNEVVFYNSLQSLKGYHNGIILGSLDSVIVDDYFGGYFDGVNDFISISHHNNLNPQSDNFSMGVKLNVSSTSSAGNIITKMANADGYSMDIKQNGLIGCEFDGSSGTSNLLSTTNIKDNQQHIIVCVKEDNKHHLWVDGILEDTDLTYTGEINNYNGLYFGTNNNLGNRFTGTISQIGIVKTAVQNSTIQSFEYNKSIGDLSKGRGIDLFFNYTFNTDDHDYFLYLISNMHFNTLGSIRVMNNDGTSSLPQEHISQVIPSEESYIDITSIINNGTNYPFRLWSLLGQNLLIDDIYLVETTEDNESPIINNCFVNTTFIGCGEKVRFQCNVTDNQAIFKTYFTILYNTTNSSHTHFQEATNICNSTIWYYDFVSEQINSSSLLYWFFVNVTDLVGNHNFISLNITVNDTCFYTCTENWTTKYTNYSCLINDTFLSFKWYEDQNSCGTFDDFPIDNATYSYGTCDYCIPYPINTSCVYNGTFGTLIEYDYFDCYSLTDLSSDIFINSTHACFPLVNELEVIYPPIRPEFTFWKDRVVWIVKLPSDDYSCWTYIKKNNMTLQMNPRKQSSIFSRSVEDREYFSSSNGLSNVYFTGDNMIIDGVTDYIWGVKCSSGNDTLTTEYKVIPQHKNTYFAVSLALWFKDNFIMFILLILSIWLTFLFLLWMWKKLKGE